MVSNNATCDGSLSSTDFQIAAKAFAEKLGFAAHGVSNGYLLVQNVFFKVQSSLKEEHGECSSNDYEEPSDNATLVCMF
ncbi:hypothetical protein Hanom_Chr08g00713941 [Helianthus anomalus]